ncbi:MAG: phosphoadenosine phosphosulfate reductase family protein [Halobacteriota archaeon]|nr:phosphoadenosine phosphosulfate reductase family protein [Halobacteriota archaeon]
MSKENGFKEKIEKSKEIVGKAVQEYGRVAVACSFGKDSMAAVHLAREVDPDIPIFSIITPFKPVETLKYLVEMDKQMRLNPIVYLVANEVPSILKENGIDVRLLSPERFEEACLEVEGAYGKRIYEVDPDRCCGFLKVEPAREAVKDLDAWVCGLRNTEGRTRKEYKEVEHRGLVKVNPILTWTEEEVLGYLEDNDIDLHPWYDKVFPDGRRIRSLGCEPCTVPIFDHQEERDGRWQGTSKCGGECGIHTQTLK